MNEPPRQLPLELPVEERYGLEDFLVGPSNESAYLFLEAWPDWPDRVVLLVGPEGSGKTHLGTLWAGRAGAARLEAGALAPDASPGEAHRLLIEDCDRGPIDEHALFHLLNRIRGEGGYALLTARTPPQHWNLATPYLVSRLRLSPLVEVAPPDDALFRSVLVKLFVDRQLVVDTSVVDFIALRIERSIAAARDLVAALDREALSRGRRITRPMTAALLAHREAGGNEPME